MNCSTIENQKACKLYCEWAQLTALIQLCWNYFNQAKGVEYASVASNIKANIETLTLIQPT